MTKDLKIVTGGAAAEAKMALENMGHVLTAAGSSFEKVVKTTIFLNDINDFGAVNEEYKKCEYKNKFVIYKYICYHVKLYNSNNTPAR